MKICLLEDIPEFGIQENLSENNEVHIFIKGKMPKGKFVNPFNVIPHFFKNQNELREHVKNVNPDLFIKCSHANNIVYKKGHYIGSNNFTKKLENDRLFGIDFIKKISKLKVARTTSDVKEAMSFKTDKLIVKSNNSNVINRIGYKTVLIYKRDLEMFAPFLKNVIFQEFIEGHEIAFGGYYGNGRFVRPYTYIQEYKQAYPKELGNLILSGESGSCGYFLDKLPTEMQSIIDAHESYLGDYAGFFDLNTIIDKKGDMYFLEYTSRMGFPTEYETLSMLDQSYLSFLLGVVQGKDYNVKAKCFCSVKVIDNEGVAPYSIAVPTKLKNALIVNVGCEKKGNYYYPLLLREDLLVVTGYSNTSIAEAREVMYKCAGKINGYGIYYLANDVGTAWKW